MKKIKKINIKGAIVPNDDKWVYDYLGLDCTCPKSVQKDIDEASGQELEVEINSGGGSVFAGSEIYTALKSHKGNVTVKIVGIAASAASVIAMAGDRVLMSPTAQMMIHNVATVSGGDYHDMEHTAEILKNANDTVANAYRIKTGMKQEDLLSLMDKESWFTPQQALDKKLIDEIMFDNVQLVASFGTSLLPQSVIDTIRNTVKNPLHASGADILLSKLNLLKLKGECRL